MSGDVLAPLTGPAFRIADKADLEEFLARPESADAVRSASFEQVFFTIKALGLGDAIELLPHVSSRQVRGFIDLDCWRKDHFVRRPFMEWMSAFIQAGPEETVRALGGVDEDVIALFLEDLIEVYEVERDDPPPATELTFTPDGRLAVRQKASGDAASVAVLILDALFRHDPDLGFRVLRRVRYTTRTELEETAYQNKVRRLDVHGFVDYYEALSIYAEPDDGETFGKPSSRPGSAEAIPGDTGPQQLPTVFAESLAGGQFLLAALEGVRETDSVRLADELTALGNRILSANLVNLGEVEGIRSALGELRDLLTIGLEHLSGGDTRAASAVLAGNHIQSVFRTGFSQIARLRNAAGRLTRIPGFTPELLESPDAEFAGGLDRFKPLLWTGKEYRSFRSVREVEEAAARIDRLAGLAGGFLELFGRVQPTLRRTFNTALIQQAVSGRCEPVPLEAGELESFLAGGVPELPRPDLPARLQPIAREWLEKLSRELEPLAGRKIDPRFVDCVHMRL